ncbi:MAG: NAD(P)H-dependent glycerol-3-phosphate dehydrogenase, partial [Myxococcota bacterium]
MAVLGAGSWGTTVATLACRNAPTRLWSRRPEIAQEINEQRTNDRYLPRTPLPRALLATDSIEEAVRDADLIVMGVPCRGVRVTLEDVK